MSFDDSSDSPSGGTEPQVAVAADASASAADAATAGAETAAPGADAPAPTPDAFPLPRTLGPEALKAFAHPLRIAMYQYLTAHGSATASQLARQLGESTGQTSYHLRQLERHGFIEDDPTKPSGRERWWRTIGFSLDARGIDDPAARLAAEVTLDAVVQERVTTLKDWFRSVPDEKVWVEGVLHSIMTTDMTLEELSALTEQISTAMDTANAAAKARRESGPVEGSRRVRIYVDAFPLAFPDEAGAPPVGDAPGGGRAG